MKSWPGGPVDNQANNPYFVPLIGSVSARHLVRNFQQLKLCLPHVKHNFEYYMDYAHNASKK